MVFTGCADIIMKEFGLVDDEEFIVIDTVGNAENYNPYKFHKGLLLDKDEDEASEIFGDIIIGILTIKKFPL